MSSARDGSLKLSDNEEVRASQPADVSQLDERECVCIVHRSHLLVPRKLSPLPLAKGAARCMYVVMADIQERRAA